MLTSVHTSKQISDVEACLILYFLYSFAGLIHDTERRKSDGGLSAMAPLKVSLIQDMR